MMKNSQSKNEGIKRKKYTYSLAFLPSQNAMLPYTMGTQISVSLIFLAKFYTTSKKNYKCWIEKFERR